LAQRLWKTDNASRGPPSLAEPTRVARSKILVLHRKTVIYRQLWKTDNASRDTPKLAEPTRLSRSKILVLHHKTVIYRRLLRPTAMGRGCEQSR
jgi:hypothetical protein